MEPVTVYLGLGSNLGHREENLSEAIALLGANRGHTLDDSVDSQSVANFNFGEIHTLRVSSVYETSPWGYNDQPDFLNCVLQASSNLPPGGLLERVKAIEKVMGRQQTVRYGPRLIDVDILFYGDHIVDRPDLQIPHPRLHQRAFVLVPLAELHRDLVHPILQITVGELASRVDEREGVRLWGPVPIRAG